jgi:hypothetical protein
MERFLFLYLIAETISTLVSGEPANSFHNLMKRAFLIPVIYVITAGAGDEKKLLRFYHWFIIFTLMSAAVYLVFSYQFLAHGIYQEESSGPSVFQYPITTAEIFSFAFLLLFALAIGEKRDIRKKLLYFSGFLLSFLALLATFKKTGFIGAVAGLVTILIIEKKWKPLIPVFAFLVFWIIANPSKSTISRYISDRGEYQITSSVNTAGQAKHLIPFQKYFLLSDYDSGLVLLDKEFKVVQRLTLPAPVVNCLPVNDTLLIAEMIQQRLVPIGFGDERLKSTQQEFISPGKYAGFTQAGGILYFLDRDSGITAVNLNTFSAHRMPAFKDYESIGIDSIRAVFQSGESVIEIFSMKNGLPVTMVIKKTFAGKKISFIRYYDSRVFVFFENHLTVYTFAADSLMLERVMPCSSVKSFYVSAASAVFGSGVNYYAYYRADKRIRQFNIKLQNSIPVTSCFADGKTVTITAAKSGILEKFIDPYHQSNLTRLSLWRAGWKIFKEHPFFGAGDIDLGDLYINYKEPYQKEIQGHLHNNYVHILATLGGFGIIAFMLLLFSIGVVLHSAMKSVRSNDTLRPFIVGTVGIFVCFLFAGLTEWNFGDHEIITLLWFFIGMAISAGKLNLPVRQ